MTDIFQKAPEMPARSEPPFEKEYERFSYDEPSQQQIEDPPDLDKPLAVAAAARNPAVLDAQTRAKSLKKLVLRLIRIYYRGQVEFNGAIYTAVAAWDRRLRRLLSEIADLLHHQQQEFVLKLSNVERRWNELESRQSSDILALSERIAVGETDFVRLEESILDHAKQFKEHQSRFDELSRALQEINKTNEAKLQEMGIKLVHAANNSIALEDRLNEISDGIHQLQERYRQDYEKQVLTPEMYFEFENRTRGSREEILEKQKGYVPILNRFAQKFEGSAKFVDLGCGRGELLELSYKAGIDMVGYDSNPAMVAHCRSYGLKATQAEMLDALAAFQDSTLAGVVAIQVLEHLTFSQISSLLSLMQVKVRAGGCVVLETINPLSVYAMRYFYMDPTHRQPIPANTSAFLLHSYGFVDIETVYLNPVQDQGLENEVIQNDEQNPIHSLLFGYQDYAVIGMKP